MYVFSVSSVSKSLVIFYRLFCKTCLHLFLKRSFSMFSVVSEARSIVLFPIDCFTVFISWSSYALSVAGIAFRFA